MVSKAMIYRRRRSRASAPSGYVHFESLHHRNVTGYTDGECVRLKDEFGNVWSGTAEMQDDRSVRYRLHDQRGKLISGSADQSGILLRDESGNTWRGYVY